MPRQKILDYRYVRGAPSTSSSSNGSSGVSSFNGRTGDVVPTNGDYTPMQIGAEPSINTGTLSQYWRGDKNWTDLATDVRSAILTGLSTATNAVITATDSVLSALGKLQAQISSTIVSLSSHVSNTSNPHNVTKAQVGLGNVDNTSDINKPVSTPQQTALDVLIPPGYIDGLKTTLVSGTALTITSGAAYIPSLNKVLYIPTDISKSGLTLAASTLYHIYLYVNAGTPDIELVTTTPSTPYNGIARTKTGDSSRRYVGSVLTDASSNLYYPVPNDRWGWSDFFATCSNTVGQPIPQGAFIVVEYPLVSRDINSEWNPSTSEFTAGKNGTYLVTAYAHPEKLTDGQSVVMSVFINGLETNRLSEQIPKSINNNSGGSVGASAVIFLKSGDIVTFQLYSGGVQTGAFIDGIPQLTYCSVYRLQ